jgi:hypothetical protein
MPISGGFSSPCFQAYARASQNASSCALRARLSIHASPCSGGAGLPIFTPSLPITSVVRASGWRRGPDDSGILAAREGGGLARRSVLRPDIEPEPPPDSNAEIGKARHHFDQGLLGRFKCWSQRHHDLGHGAYKDDYSVLPTLS